MTTTAHILKPFLAEFAKELLADGFKVYLFTSDIQRVAKGGKAQWATWFGFSREVEGIECWASVSEDFFQSVKFSMPIPPSTRNGSGMFVEKSDERATVANARLYASPNNYNHLVGIQQNAGAKGFGNLVTEVTE